MLEQLARHGRICLEVEAEGDLHVDFHHTTEDTGIVIGQAVAQALGDRRGIRRYGMSYLPMAEALTRVAIALSNRPYLLWNVELPMANPREMDTKQFRHIFPASVQNPGSTP